MGPLAGRGGNASGGSGRLMRSVSPSGTYVGASDGRIGPDASSISTSDSASTPPESDGFAASTGSGTASPSRGRPSISSSADSAAVTSRSLLPAPICSSARAIAAPSWRALAKRSRGS